MYQQSKRVQYQFPATLKFLTSGKPPIAMKFNRQLVPNCMMALHAVFICAALLFNPAWGQQGAKVEFARDVLPILSDRCFQCHGPDAAGGREADLRLDEYEDLMKPRGGYRVLVPGEPDKSELFHRVSASDADLVMPPPELHRELSAQQVEVLRLWIEQGASWGKHWSFEPPKRPSLKKSITEPVSENDALDSSHPIDILVARQLKGKGLVLNPRANRRTLIRRLSLDLKGLPPTSAEMQDFLQDNSSEAWRSLVQRTLDSPAFGERMAWDWLEAARYADSNGYQGDRERTMWPWRDWVVRAFNENLPFDQFTVWQLAGDLLPDATEEQILATGFCRNHMINGEGGRIAEENRVDYVMDMTETMGTVWMGLTLNCCRCHDHKFDPLLQKEYYQLTAFFNQTPVTGKGGDPQTAPIISYADASQRREKKRIEAELAALSKREKVLLDSLRNNQREWESQQLSSFESNEKATWVLLSPVSAKADVQDLKIRADKHVLASGENASNDRYVVSYRLPRELSKREWAAIKLDAIRHPSMTAGGLARSNSGNFVLTDIRFRARENEASVWKTIAVQSAKATFEQGGLKITNAFDSNRQSGWAVHEGRLVDRDHAAVFVLRQRIAPEMSDLEVELDFASKHAQHNLGRFAISVTANPEALPDLANSDLASALRVKSKNRNEEQVKVVRDAYLNENADYKRIQEKRKSLLAQRKSLNDSIPKVMVMQDRDDWRSTFVLKRGLYNQPQEEVRAQTPAILPPLHVQHSDKDASNPNRLDLAEWLVHPSNPLTARVIVNRYWQMLFGVGLVKTTEDFGVQSEYPVQKELLDWLALEFVESGWDVKHLLATIVTSETYQRSSFMTTELHEKDPANKYLTRGPRFRMPSWMIRDQALAVSGLLSPTVGGAPVQPYQPAGIWSEATFGKKKYAVGKGEQLYRRSLYTFWRRIIGPTMFFDAGKRQVCEVKPLRTNTPMHALTTLNDTTYVEASRVLAERALSSNAEHPLDWLAGAVLGRELSLQESKIWLNSYKKALQYYTSHQESAKELLKVGQYEHVLGIDVRQHAAWTNVCLNMLNLDEALTKE